MSMLNRSHVPNYGTKKASAIVIVSPTQYLPFVLSRCFSKVVRPLVIACLPHSSLLPPKLLTYSRTLAFYRGWVPELITSHRRRTSNLPLILGGIKGVVWGNLSSRYSHMAIDSVRTTFSLSPSSIVRVGTMPE